MANLFFDIKITFLYRHCLSICTVYFDLQRLFLIIKAYTHSKQIYNISFVETPKFNYAAALSVFILVVVAVLSAIQMKVGDKRD